MHAKDKSRRRTSQSKARSKGTNKPRQEAQANYKPKKTGSPGQLQLQEDSKPRPTTSPIRQQAQANNKTQKTASQGKLQDKEDSKGR